MGCGEIVLVLVNYDATTLIETGSLMALSLSLLLSLAHVCLNIVCCARLLWLSNIMKYIAFNSHKPLFFSLLNSACQ